uniref:Transcription factor ste11 n=1 Tax=Zeugodacus cucurbitae TaxID=28588 RepID=A0A0A1XHS8_ZEUCU
MTTTYVIVIVYSLFYYNIIPPRKCCCGAHANTNKWYTHVVLAVLNYSARQSNEANRKSLIQLKSFDSTKFSSASEVVMLTRDELDDLLARLCCLTAGEPIFIDLYLVCGALVGCA